MNSFIIIIFRIPTKKNFLYLFLLIKLLVRLIRMYKLIFFYLRPYKGGDKWVKLTWAPNNGNLENYRAFYVANNISFLIFKLRK